MWSSVCWEYGKHEIGVDDDDMGGGGWLGWIWVGWMGTHGAHEVGLAEVASQLPSLLLFFFFSSLSFSSLLFFLFYHHIGGAILGACNRPPFHTSIFVSLASVRCFVCFTALSVVLALL
jgi:hypothetical protein